jgi:hypothetical protein
MPKPLSLPRWLRLPSRVALVLGLGALSAPVAQADLPENRMLPAGLGDTLIRSENGKIYLSEGGREIELRLGATPERDRLFRLLEEHGPAGIRLEADPRLIMSGGGGTGFSLWERTKSSDKPPPGPAQENMPPKPPQQGSTPNDPNPASDKKS